MLFSGSFSDLILRPANLLVVALAAACVLLFLKRDRIGRMMATAVAGIFLAFLLLPLDKWLAAPLENRFLPPPEIEQADGIVVLGGDYIRVYVAALLAHEFPAARIVFVGGSGNGTMPFADRAQAALVRLGVAPERLSVGDRSLNTWDDMGLAKELADPKPGQTWLLVTSAAHMPRAMGVAQHLGWRMIPSPVGFISRVPGFMRLDVAQNARLIDQSLHEYFGLIAYRLQGKTDALFPRPDAGP